MSVSSQSAAPVICGPSAHFAQALESLPRPIVFTNGCFDILHIGHITLLKHAAGLGASLIVAVNSDSSVRRQGKDHDRPFNDESQRAAMLASIRWVDCVVMFDDDTPLTLVTQAMPDVLVKGGDWPIETIVGADQVTQNGGAGNKHPI